MIDQQVYESKKNPVIVKEVPFIEFLSYTNGV
jgi:hypothetical protein